MPFRSGRAGLAPACHLAIVLLLLTLSVATLGQAPAVPAPSRANTQEERQRAIRELSDKDFAGREAAADFLWQCGLATKPLLEQAVAEGDPEAADRAREILKRFEKKDIGKLPTDRAGRIVLCFLRLRQNAWAVRDLLKENPTDQELKEFFSAIPDMTLRRRAVSCLSDDTRHLILLARDQELGRAESFIETAAASGHPAAVRRWVAYLVVTDRARKVRDAMEKQAAASNLGASRLPLLSALRYATGNHDGALKLAEKIDYVDVKLSVVLRRDDWIAAGEVVAETVPCAVAQRAVRMHAAQLAGDKERADELLAEALAQDEKGRATGGYIPLLLANRIDDLQKALGRGHYASHHRVNLLLSLGRLEEAKRCAPKKGMDAWTQKFPGIIPVVPGKISAAADRKETNATEFIKAMQHKHWAKIQQRSLQHAVERIKAYRAKDKPIPMMLESIVCAPFSGASVAVRLFGIIEAANPEAPTLAVMQRVSSLLYVDAPLEPVQRLAAEGTGSALKPKDMSDADWLELIAETCWSRGLEKEATDYLHRAIAAGGCPFRLTYTLLPTLPREERLPLLRTVARRALSDDKRAMTAVQALAACEYLDPVGGDDLPLQALLAIEHNGYEAYWPWNLTFLEPLGVNPDVDSANRLQRYFRIPGFSHNSDMIPAFLKEGRFPEALQEIKIQELLLLARSASHSWDTRLSQFTRLRRLRIAALLGMGKREEVRQLVNSAAMWASDIHGTIDIVNILDDAGMKAEADKVFRVTYQMLGGANGGCDYSMNALNGMAWLCARCGRELENARKYSERTIEHSPRDPAYYDTLAHVLAAQGKFDEAIAV
ncbi:MAG: hypothetical protein KAI66_16470, partial [Lentisphaeria bacterium]|nr:hypothetical protein [Lentisphaeria bacterium]